MKPKAPVTSCECGRPLSQPYARQMGECVTCCLKRIRDGQGRGIMVRVTSSSGLSYQRKYNRSARQVG